MQQMHKMHFLAAAIVLLLCQYGVDSTLTAASCYGSIGGISGHIYQFDGGILNLGASKCSAVIAQATSGRCNVRIVANFACKRGTKKLSAASRLKTLSVTVNGNTFQLLSHRRLAVNKKLRNIPFAGLKSRVFLSGEDAVFVHKKCNFWATFDGEFTATFRFGARWRRRFSGLAGNCDGRRGNDPKLRSKSDVQYLLRKRLIGQCRFARKKSLRCRTRRDYAIAQKVCAAVILRTRACASSILLKACIADYCATNYLPKLQRKVLCANFYLHARRCARHRNPIAWRSIAGCPAKCGSNQHYSNKIPRCPKTCENHFFGSPKRCFKLVSPEGCTCNRGFVLDGARCVRPNQCVCLAKLCIDRVSHSKCRYWRSLGRCKRFPQFMASNCRLTCGLCTPRCRNQISTKLCKYYARKGKCSNSFYRAMCQATCNPSGCGCPPRRIYTTKCSKKYLNKAIVHKKWWPDVTGKCRKSVIVSYRTCGLCRRINKLVRGSCNFCKKVAIDRRIVQYRERNGKRRCLRRVKKIVRACVCKRRARSKDICVNNNTTVRVTKFWKITGRCSRCERRISRRVLRRISCSGIVTRGKCSGRKAYVYVKTYKRVARNCRCYLRHLRTVKYRCRCRKLMTTKTCAGNRWLIITKRWVLRNGKCVLKVHRRYRNIPCRRRLRRQKICIRKLCRAILRTSYYSVRSCSCRRTSSDKVLGKCCCPPSYTRTKRINIYYKKKIVIKYVLVNYKCRRIMKMYKIRIRCPKGGSSFRCNAATGVKVYKSWHYVLVRNSCLRKVINRRVSIKCRQPIRRVEGRCNIIRGNTKFRRTRIYYSRRKGCRCVRKHRTVREMCGCRKGRFTAQIRCPRGCTSRSCSSKCNRYVVYYRYAARGKTCHRIIFRKLRFRCCCRPQRKVTHRCRNNQFLIRKVCSTVLKNGKCQRVCSSSSRRIKCRIGTVYSWQPHSNRAYRYRVKTVYFIRNCKCRKLVTKKLCRSRCNKRRIRKFCDTVRRNKVVQFIRWKLIGCRKCVRIVKEKRIPVRCRTGKSAVRKCLSNGVLRITITHYGQVGCRCTARNQVVLRRCRCRNQRIGKRICQSNVWVRKVKYWILRNDRCLIRYRYIRNRVICSRRRRYRIRCNKKLGIRRKYLGVLIATNCKCGLVWKLVLRNRCNCRIDNARVSSKRRKWCRNNRKITTRYYYVLRNGRCVLRSRHSSRAVICPKSFVRRHRCNLKTRKQLYVRHSYSKRNCKCILRRSKFYKSCGCSRKVVAKKICKKMQGIILRIYIRQRWSHKLNRCETERRIVKHQVACRRNTKYRSTRCIRNKYYVVKEIFYVRHGCRCVQRIRRKRFNCHCRSITKKYKCPKRGYFLRHITRLRKWDMKTKKCITVKYVRRKIRCRCPNGYVKKFCSAGFKVTRFVKIVLRNARCYRNIINRRRPVVCRGRVKYSYTKCSKCNRYKLTLRQMLNKKTCRCYYKIIRRQRCTCCCPKNTKRKWCSNGTHWIVQRIKYAPYLGTKCSTKCRRWIKRQRLQIPCSRRRRYRWLPCNRRNCISKQQLSEYRLKNCRCVIYRRLTGRKRTCCCRANRKTKNVCLNSCLFAKTYYNKFIPYRCVRKSSLRLLRVWKCRGRIGIVVGKCNRYSCKQRVQDKFSEVARPFCKCRMRLRNLRYRNCCCKRKNSVQRRCLGSCWHITRKRYSFDKNRRVCVQNVKRSRVCIRCAAKPRKVYSCNRSSCRRKVVTFTARVINCKCRYFPRVSYAVCCCARPRVTGPVCIRGRTLQWTRTSYKLRSGRCMRRVRKTSRDVKCRRGVIRTRVLRCNRSNCRQKVLRLFLQLRQCACKKYWKSSSRLCCCRPAVRTWTRCERNTHLVRYTVTQTLSRNRRCIARKVKQILSVTSRCRSRVRVGSCNPKSRVRIVTIFIRKPRNCRCVVVNNRRQRVLCRCPPARTIRGKCSKKTCHRKITKIWFTSSKKGHGVQCRRHQRISRLRCCCHRQQRIRNFCDRRTGSLMRQISWFVFAARTRTCVRRSRLVVIRRLSCRRPICNVSKCNRRSGFKIRSCKYFLPNRASCKCRMVVKRTPVVCYCRPPLRVRKCLYNTRIMTVTTKWKLSLRRNRCIRLITRSYRDVRCQRKKFIRKTCRGCSGYKTLYFYKVRNCKCVQLRKKWNIRCCCKKPTSRTRCIDNRKVITKYYYNLIRDRCVLRQRQRFVRIPCKRRRVTRSRCRNCKFTKTISQFAVRNCRCTRINRRVYNLHCCCAKAINRKFCKNGNYIKRKIYYKLRNYRCLRQIKQKIYRVQCPRSTVHISGCNKLSRKRRIITTKFVKRGCKCIKMRQVRYELCRCKPSIIVRQRCIRNRIRRKIIKVSWQFIRRNKPFCRKIQKLLRYEPCKCRSNRIQRFCVANRRHVTVTTRWTLKNRYGRNFCAAKSYRSERLIKCNRRYVKWTACNRFRKTRITIFYRSVKCRCRKFSKRRVFACQCSKKNNNRKFCDSRSGRIIKIYNKYYADKGSSKCRLLTRKRIIRIVCNRRPRTYVIGRKCSIRKNYGIYTNFIQKWKIRVGCKCKKMSRKFWKLCRCIRGSRSTTCRNNNTYVTVKVQIVRNGNSCKRRRIVTKRVTRCSNFRPRISFGGCSRSRCKRSVTVKQCFVRNCRTQLYLRSALQRCCTPSTKRRSYCDAKTGNIVTVITKYRLKTSGPLLKDRNGNVVVSQKRVIARKITTRRRVKCYSRSVRDSCSRSGVWKRVIRIRYRSACRCRTKRIVQTGRCKCPGHSRIWSKCINKYKNLRTIWFVLKARKCIRKVSNKRYLCACARNRKYTICDKRGSWKTCHVTYQLKFRQQRCQRRIRCRRRPQTCNKSSVYRSKCINYKQNLIITKWIVNKRTCKCVKRKHTRRVGCNCHRKKHRNVRCINGSYVTSFYSYYLRNYRCHRRVRRVYRKIRCNTKHIHKLVSGSCIRKAGRKYSGFQKRKTIWQVKVGCKCKYRFVIRWVPCRCSLIRKYRTRRFKSCSRGTIYVTKIVRYVLKGLTCVRVVRYQRRVVRCRRKRVVRGKCRLNKRGDSYKIIKYYLRVSDGKCRCIWKLVRTQYRICSCRKQRTVSLCLRDRIRRKEIWRYVAVAGKAYCRRVVKRIDSVIRCPKKYWRTSKCTNCNFVKVQYGYRPKKCRCRLTKLKILRLKCCCAKTTTRKFCDKKRNIKYRITTSYKLNRGRCIRRISRKSVTVRCNRKLPLYKFQKCKSGYRLFRKTVYYVAACRCIARVTHHKQKCSCSARVILKRGKCIGYFAKDLVIRWRLTKTKVVIPGTNRRKFKCVRYVAAVRRRRCRCPKARRLRRCRSNRLYSIRIRYRLSRNRCQRIKKVGRIRIGCTGQPKLLRIVKVYRSCSRKYRYVQKLRYEYVQARKCKCVKYSKTVSYICNCYLRYGGKHRRSKCIKQNLLRTYIWWKINVNRKCVKRSKIVNRKIRCNGSRVTAGKCDRNGRRWFKIWHKVARNCRCVWRVKRHLSAACRCRRNSRLRRCKGGAWVTEIRRWRLVGSRMFAKCKLYLKRKVQRVACRVGTFTRRTRCDARGNQKIIYTNRRLHKCRCIVRKRFRNCKCKCRKNRNQKICRGNRLTFIKQTYKLRKCKCISDRKVSHRTVRCPATSRRILRCRRSSNGDKQQTILYTSYSMRSCKCKMTTRKSVRICGCDPRTRILHRCINGNMWFRSTTKRVLVRGRCVRRTVNRRSVTIRCGKLRTRKVCNKKTGIFTVFVIKPFVYKCKCKQTVYKFTRRCGCNGRRRLISKGKCSRKTCRRRLLYKKQILRNMKCVWKQYHRFVLCCCKGGSVRRICERTRGFWRIITTQRILRAGQCVTRVNQRTVRVYCSRKATVQKRKLKNGILRIVRCYRRRKYCRCVRKCKTTFLRYRCRAAVSSKRCRCSRGRCSKIITVRYWKLRNGRCIAKTRSNKIPLRCPAGRLVRSKCRRGRYGWYLWLKRIRYVQRKCRCVIVAHKQQKVCRCLRNSMTKSCNRRTGITTKSIISYQVAANGRSCIRKVTKRTSATRCNRKYKLIRRIRKGKTEVKVYRRFVRVACRCKAQIKRVRCLIRCPRCRSIVRCMKNRIRVRVRYCWKLRHCFCVKTRSVHSKTVRCGKNRITSRCNRRSCVRTVTRTRNVAVGCKCRRKTSVHRSRCCCPRNRVVQNCVGGSIRIRTIRYTLINGRCHASRKDQFRPVRCSRRTRTAIRGKCIQGRRKYSLHYLQKRGCRCVPRVRIVTRPCVCAHKAVELIFAVDLHDKNRRNYRSGVRKCIKGICSTFYEQMVLRKSTFVTFGRRVKVTSHIRRYDHLRIKNIADKLFVRKNTDLASAIAKINKFVVNRRNKKAHPIVVIISCGKHPHRARILRRAAQLRKVASVVVVQVGNDPNASKYLRMVASAPRRHNFIKVQIKDMLSPKKHKFLATQVFERVCKRACRRSQLSRSRCNRRNCKRVYTQIVYRRSARNNQCIRKTRSWRRDCCCRYRGGVRYVCRSNRRYRISVTYVFNPVQQLCKKRVRTTDISGSLLRKCRPRISRSSSPCRNMWRHVTEIRRRIVNCKCKVTRSTRRIRCGCPRSQRVTRCLGNRHRICIRRYILRGSVCIPSQKCHLVPVVCKKHWQKVSKCRSCIRIYSKVWYQVSNCRCVRRYRQWKRRCCCSRRKIRVKVCDKKRNRYVITVTWKKLINGKCQSISKRTYVSVRCRSQTVLRGRCRRVKGHFYRVVTVLNWYKRNCKCIKQRKQFSQLCRCNSGRIIRQCRSGAIVTLRKFWKKLGNRCVPQIKTLSRRIITCSSIHRKQLGSCTIVRNHLLYRKVTITWQIKRGCKCFGQRKVVLQLCGCRKSFTRVTCIRNSTELRTVYRYRLVNGKCKLYKKIYRKIIRCKFAKSSISQCRNGRKSVRIVVYRPVLCKCKPTVYNRSIKCTSACRDLLPSKVCSAWAGNHIQLCNNHPHYAKKLCARTCGLCYDCKSTALVYAGRICLQIQPGFRKKYVIGKVRNIDLCMSKCHRSKRCRSIIYDWKRKSCLLLRVNRRDMIMRSPNHKLITSRRCLLIEKVCPKRCPYRRIIKKYRCKCRVLRRKICYRKVKVATYYRDISGSCRRRITKMRVPCKQCENRTHIKWCIAHKRYCNKPKVKYMCPFTCGLCHRKPLVLTQKGKCRKGRRTVVRVTRIYDKRSEMWKIRKWKTSKICVKCATGSYTIIGECIAGKRKISKIVARRIGKKCSVKAKVKYFSCKGCTFSLRRVIGRCQKRGRKWTRNVVTFFTVRRRHKCIVLRDVRRYRCSPKCPSDRVTRSKCHCGKRIRCIRYFVTFAGSHACVPKTHSSTELCQSECSNKMGLQECMIVQKRGMCRKLGFLCARTCAICK